MAGADPEASVGGRGVDVVIETVNVEPFQGELVSLSLTGTAVLKADEETRIPVPDIVRITRSDIDSFQETRKISSSCRLERDLILYALWQTGLFTNQQIADVFNIGFSMISHAVHGCRKKYGKIES